MVKKRITSVVAPLVMFLLVFGIWELLCRVNETPAWFLPTPSAIFTAMVVNFNEYLPHILVTLEVVLIGFLITIPVGLLLATLITRSPIISAALNPYVTFLVTTPMICLIPLLMLMLGYGLTLRITVVVIQSFAIINMNACTGFLNVPTMRKELMQSMGASPIKTYFKMSLPSAATEIFTGIQLAAIMATTACISVEYNAGNTGLGSQIIKYSQYMKVTDSFACIFFVMIIGVLLYALVTFAQKKIISWKE